VNVIEREMRRILKYEGRPLRYLAERIFEWSNELREMSAIQEVKEYVGRPRSFRNLIKEGLLRLSIFIFVISLIAPATLANVPIPIAPWIHDILQTIFYVMAASSFMIVFSITVIF